MAYRINHIHLKAPDPGGRRVVRDGLGFEIVSEEVRGSATPSSAAGRGWRVAVTSGARTTSASTRRRQRALGLEHFGVDRRRRGRHPRLQCLAPRCSRVPSRRRTRGSPSCAPGRHSLELVQPRRIAGVRPLRERRLTARRAFVIVRPVMRLDPGTTASASTCSGARRGDHAGALRGRERCIGSRSRSWRPPSAGHSPREISSTCERGPRHDGSSTRRPHDSARCTSAGRVRDSNPWTRLGAHPAGLGPRVGHVEWRLRRHPLPSRGR